MAIRIKITGRGLCGNPTPDNPTGEYPIDYEFDTDAAFPVGWVGRAEIVQPEPKRGAKFVANA